jgi:hypothetical protein
MAARKFTVTRPGSNCLDCGQEMESGEVAVYLGRNRYAHDRPCTDAQVAAAASGSKQFWTAEPSVQGGEVPDPLQTLRNSLIRAKEAGVSLAELVPVLEEVYEIQ